MIKDTGGPAFPRQYSVSGIGNIFYAQDGMTSRDWFAGQAMQALIAKSPFLAEPQDFEVYKKTAIGAYDYADAMIAERNKS